MNNKVTVEEFIKVLKEVPSTSESLIYKKKNPLEKVLLNEFSKFTKEEMESIPNLIRILILSRHELLLSHVLKKSACLDQISDGGKWFLKEWNKSGLAKNSQELAFIISCYEEEIVDKKEINVDGMLNITVMMKNNGVEEDIICEMFKKICKKYENKIDFQFYIRKFVNNTHKDISEKMTEALVNSRGGNLAMRGILNTYLPTNPNQAFWLSQPTKEVFFKLIKLGGKFEWKKNAVVNCVEVLLDYFKNPDELVLVMNTINDERFFTEDNKKVDNIIENLSDDFDEVKKIYGFFKMKKELKIKEDLQKRNIKIRKKI